MRVIVLFKERTDYARQVNDFIVDFKRQTGHDLEVIDPDSSEGTSFTEAYDILEFPTIIAVSDDGQIQTEWKGIPLPTISEVSYYVQ